MRAEPDRRTRGAERTAAVERLAGGGLVFVDDGQLVLVESHVGVGDVAVDEVEKSVGLDGDDAVAARVAGRGNVRHAVRNALRRRELVVRSVLERRHGRVERLDLVRFSLGSRADDLRIREEAQCARVVGVLVGDEDLRDLLRLVAKVGKRLDVRLDFLADIDCRILRRFAKRKVLGDARIDEDDFAPGVDHPVLEARAVLDRRVESFRAFATKGKRTRHETVLGKTNWLYRYAHCFIPFYGLSILVSRWGRPRNQPPHILHRA